MGSVGLDEFDLGGAAVDWVWMPFVARGYVTLLVGAEGVGKSWVVADLMARVVANRPMPGEDGADHLNHTVLFLDAEGSVHITRSRLQAMLTHDDLARIRVPTRYGQPLDSELDHSTRRLLEREIRKFRPTLFVVDSLSGGFEIEHTHKMRRSLRWLGRMGAKYEMAVVATVHQKWLRPRGPALDNVAGSRSLIRLARSIVQVESDGNGGASLTVVKSNLVDRHETPVAHMTITGEWLEWQVVPSGGEVEEVWVD